MEAVSHKLEEYVREDGTNPFRGWLLRLRDKAARATIRVRLNRVRLGNFGDVKPVGDGVSELRIAHGPGYRVYLGRVDTALVILLCGGVKTSQKKDIEIAKEYWQDYRRRIR